MASGKLVLQKIEILCQPSISEAQPDTKELHVAVFHFREEFFLDPGEVLGADDDLLEAADHDFLRLAQRRVKLDWALLRKEPGIQNW